MLRSIEDYLEDADMKPAKKSRAAKKDKEKRSDAHFLVAKSSKKISRKLNPKENIEKQYAELIKAKKLEAVEKKVATETLSEEKKSPEPVSRKGKLFTDLLGTIDEKVVKTVKRTGKANLTMTETMVKAMPDSKSAPSILEVGEVVYIGDGICKISGLTNARIDDVLRIKTDGEDVLVLVLGITGDMVETVVLGDYFTVKKGNMVFSTQKTLKIPAGPGILGRVLSPIGRPIDGKGPLDISKQMNVERPAPAVYMRTPIVDQLRTGFIVIDSIIPVGRGQRELVTGDRKTGKSRLMADVICNVTNRDIYCIYVAIGGQKAKIKEMAMYLDKYGALKNTTIVLASSDDPPSLNYLAPYAGSAIAEYFCDLGKDALIIYDDLSKHAKAYRQMSLLLKRSPGRDAYPGDIFYLHSRLLERSAKVADEFGGGSITALPICETQNGDISEYITTNLMSITDGHMYLDSQMMHDGIFPAVNSSSSVSRIGGSIQAKLLRKFGAIAGSQLARYNDVKSYETMNTEITEETEREINRGKRILEIFNQPSGLNFDAPEETILLYIVTEGYLDYIPIDVVAILKVEIITYYHDNMKSFTILTDQSMSKDADDKDMSHLEEFMKQYFNTGSDPAKALKEAYEKKLEKAAAAEAEKVAVADESADKKEKK